MNRYIAYCRKSTDESNRQVLSIDAQINELKEFALRENLLITEFVSESKTAKEPGREKFESVLQKIENGLADGILSWHPDRLARNSIDGGKVIYLLDTGKLKDLKFPIFWFDNTPQGKFMLSIAFGQSKYYIDNLSENVKRGIRQKLRQGVYPGRPPLGYLNDRNAHQIVVDEEKSLVVKKGFEMFSSERSFSNISRFFFEKGIKSKFGKPLDISQVKAMLVNRFYLGVFMYNGEWHKGNHKTFISQDLFDLVQSSVRSYEKPRRNGLKFVFRGLSKCGECGAAITSEVHNKFYKVTNRSASYVYYHCTHKTGNCRQDAYLREEDYESQLRQAISNVALPDAWREKWFEWFEKDKLLEARLADQKIQAIEGEIKKVGEKESKLLDGYLEGTIDPLTYKLKKSEFFEEKLKLENRILKLRGGQSEILEPFSDFLNRAFQARKIARAKNNAEELVAFGKSVGSNWFITDQKLSAVFKKGYSAVFLCSRKKPDFLENPGAHYGQGRKESNFRYRFWRPMSCH